MDHLLCVLCRSYLTYKPWQASCGHHLCGRCYEQQKSYVNKHYVIFVCYRTVFFISVKDPEPLRCTECKSRLDVAEVCKRLLSLKS